MIELIGKYNSTKVFTDNIEQTAVDQIIELCNQEFLKDSKVRIMPDCHAGAGCTIGTTMTIKDKVVPNLVGVDIGCGVGVVKISNKDIDFAKLDHIAVGHNLVVDFHNLDYNFLDCNCSFFYFILQKYFFIYIIYILSK